MPQSPNKGYSAYCLLDKTPPAIPLRFVSKTYEVEFEMNDTFGIEYLTLSGLNGFFLILGRDDVPTCRITTLSGSSHFII